MARGKLGRKAKKVSSMAYQVNRALGVPKRKAKRRANKAGRKYVAKKLGKGRRKKGYSMRRRRRY